MNVRKPILLLTILFAWLGGTGSVWAVSQTGENAYVSYYSMSYGFDIMFKVNGTGDWQSTTFGNGGYKTVVKINDGDEQSIGYGNFQFGQVYTVGGIQVSIEASIADATTKAVTVQYNIKNTNSYAVKLQIGSWADTQVGDDDSATITRESHNTIMMTASGGAMYGITAGTDPFTTLWYGYYGSADENVFNDNQGQYQGTSTDSGLAWSWTINSIPAGGTKIIAFGGLASQKGAVSMASYKYGTTPSTPSVSGITGNPSITYYYSTNNNNSGGTVWNQSSITGTTLNAGVYYMYAYIGATGTSAAMTTQTTPFTVAKGDYNMNGVTFPNGTFTYDGNSHSLAISGTLPSGVSVSYSNNGRTNAGYQTVTANFSTNNSNYNAPPGMTATLTINKATPQASDFAFTPPSALVYDGTQKTASVVTNLTGGKTGMGTITVKYYSGTTQLSSAPKDAGTYTVKIDVAAGTNYNAATNLTASSWTFTIAKATPQASDFAYTAPSPLMYDGKQKTAKVATNLTGGKTGMGVITVNYFQGTTSLGTTAPIDAGTYTVKINVAEGTNYNAASNITASSWTFTINRRPITTTTITVADITYDASAHNTIDRLTVKYGDFTIPSSNYTVEPASVTEAGTYTLTIVGKTNLTGFTTRELKVTKDMTTHSFDIKISATDDQITPIPTQIYDGTYAARPTFFIFDKDKLLTPSNDYTFDYGTNNTEGTAAGSITIYGAGVYSGSKDFTFAIVNEYFEEGNFTYHATSSNTVAVGKKDHTSAIATTTTGTVEIPATVSHVVATPFQVTGIETGAFKNCTDITGISMPQSTVYLEYIEDAAFEGCTALHYIDFCNATAFVPASLERDIADAPFFDVSKQALIYLNGTAVAGENYVYKVGATDFRCDEFKIYDDVNGAQTGFTGNDYMWSLENIYPFTAKNIINTRRLLAGQHYTVFLPYALPIPADMKAYKLAGANTTKNLIGFVEVIGTLTEFMPYVVIASETGQSLGTTDATVPVFNENTSGMWSANGVTLNGTLKYISGDDANGKYIMQSGNTWKLISGSPSYSGACILPMRAYISEGASAARAYLSASFTDAEHNTTKVEQLRLDEDTDRVTIYDLQGRKIQNPQRKGIYIINGRKVIR